MAFSPRLHTSKRHVAQVMVALEPLVDAEVLPGSAHVVAQVQVVGLLDERVSAAEVVEVDLWWFSDSIDAAEPLT